MARVGVNLTLTLACFWARGQIVARVGVSDNSNPNTYPRLIFGFSNIDFEKIDSNTK